jgi:hypothetical protein
MPPSASTDVPLFFDTDPDVPVFEVAFVKRIGLQYL